MRLFIHICKYFSPVGVGIEGHRTGMCLALASTVFLSELAYESHPHHQRVSAHEDLGQGVMVLFHSPTHAVQCLSVECLSKYISAWLRRETDVTG